MQILFRTVSRLVIQVEAPRVNWSHDKHFSHGPGPALGGVADHGIEVNDFRRGRGPFAVFGHIDYAYHRYLLSIVRASIFES